MVYKSQRPELLTRIRLSAITKSTSYIGTRGYKLPIYVMPTSSIGNHSMATRRLKGQNIPLAVNVNLVVHRADITFPNRLGGRI